MECKAVIFDLFETLITEWGRKKYTKKEMCADLGIDRSHFDFFWEEKEQERYLGTINFENSIIYACEKCGASVDPITAQDTNMLITNSAYIRFEYNFNEQKCGFRKNVSQRC